MSASVSYFRHLPVLVDFLLYGSNDCKVKNITLKQNEKKIPFAAITFRKRLYFEAIEYGNERENRMESE